MLPFRGTTAMPSILAMDVTGKPPTLLLQAKLTRECADVSDGCLEPHLELADAVNGVGKSLRRRTAETWPSTSILIGRQDTSHLLTRLCD